MIDLPTILALGASGALAWALRTIPSTLGGALRRLALAEVTVWRRETVRAIDALLSQEHPTTRGKTYQIEADQDTLGPGVGWHLLRWRGRRYLIQRDTEKGGGPMHAAPLRMPWVKIWCRGSAVHIERLIADALAEQERRLARSRRPPAWITDPWRCWAEIEGPELRTLDAVVLPDGVAEDMRADARRWRDSEPWYRERYLSWRRGWLLSGPPGTGKTRAAVALAQDLGLRLYVLGLDREGMTDAHTEKLLAQVPPGSLVLIDDVDRLLLDVPPACETAPAVTTRGLLSALDGLYSDGWLVVMTANDPSKLDPALTRAGRIDRRWEFGPATEGQARRLYERLHPTANGRGIEFGRRFAGRTMAEAQEAAIAERP